MSVRNLGPYVRESVESILAQSYRDFEFVIRDDGSSDATLGVLRSLARNDRRMILYEGANRLGPAGSSNWVASRARGNLLARMDGDDWSHPDRLLRQIEVFAANPDAVLVGTLCETMNEKGRVVRGPEGWRLARCSRFAPFPHGSIMFRRAPFEAVGGYRGAADFWEDLDLYRRLAAHGELVVIPEALYRHRATTLSTRLVSSSAAVEASVDRMFRETGGSTRAGRGGRIAPRVFASLGSTVLWSGGRPAILRRLLNRGDLRLDRDSLLVAAWAVWAKLSPGTLRFCLQWVGRARNWRAARRMPVQHLYRWDIPDAAPAEITDRARGIDLSSGEPEALRA